MDTRKTKDSYAWLKYSLFSRTSSKPGRFYRIPGFLQLLMCYLVIATPAWAVEVVRGPYLQVITEDSVVVRWRTDVATDTNVNFGPSTTVLTRNAHQGVLSTEHEVRLTALEAATRYYYEIGSSAETLAGDTSYTFVTAPEDDSDQPVRVWVLGDSGTADEGASSVRDGYKAFAGDNVSSLWLMLGDNAYEDGLDFEYQEAVFDMYPELLRQLPLYSTMGNHEGHSASSGSESGPYYDIFTFPRNGEAGGVPSGTEAYYSFDYGNIHFVNLDSHDSNLAADGPMLTWLENDLAATSKQWVIAFWHHPAYSKGSHDSDESWSQTAMRERAVPILEAYGVDLVMSGHSHSYERSFLINGHHGLSTSFNSSMLADGGSGREDEQSSYSKTASGAPNEGAVFVVAGNGGKVSETKGTLDHPAMYMSAREMGSLVLDVQGNRLDFSFVNESGVQRDYFTITKGADTTPPSIRSANAESETQIDIKFSEPLDVNSAEQPAHYALVRSGISASAVSANVVSAALADDEQTVQLTTLPLEENVPYTLSVTNVSDTTNNTINNNAAVEIVFTRNTSISFQYGVAPEAGYSDVQDLHLIEAQPDINFGAVKSVEVDGNDGGTEQSALLRWDLGGVPQNATITGASITVNVTSATDGSYRIYEMSRPWSEDGATWNQDGIGAAWSSPGATGGGDHYAEILGLFSNLPTGVQTIELNDAAVEALQAWVSGDRPNNGLLVYHPDTRDGLRFSSREDDAVERPRLTVNFTTSGTGPGDTGASVLSPANARTIMKFDTAMWIAWDDYNQPAASGFRVLVNGVNKGVMTSPEYKMVGVSADTNYLFEIAAIDEAGNESGYVAYTDSTYPVIVNWPKRLCCRNRDRNKPADSPVEEPVVEEPAVPEPTDPVFVEDAFIVDTGHSLASDSNPGTENSPWRTIAHAADTLRAGETAYVKAGVYGGDVEFAHSGIRDNEIVLQAYPGQERQAIVDDGTILIRNESHIKVIGLKVQNVSDSYGFRIDGNPDPYGQPVENITISGMHFYDTFKSAISVWGVRYQKDPGDFNNIVGLVIEHNLVEKANNGGYNENITLANGVVDAVVRFNEVTNGGDPIHGGEGIDFKDGVRDSKIHDNYIHGLNRRAIYVDGGESSGAVTSNIHVYNNLIIDDPSSAIMIATEGAGEVDGIYIYNNVVLGSEQNGISVYHHPEGDELAEVKNIHIVNNTVIDGGRGGSGWGNIRVNHDTATGVVIRNNVTRDGNGFDIKGNSGIGISEDYRVEVSNNLCRDSFCEVKGEPMFVNPTFDADTANYRLKTGSPAIDAGIVTDAPEFDADGVTRPLGAAIDLGAYEYMP